MLFDCTFEFWLSLFCDILYGTFVYSISTV